MRKLAILACSVAAATCYAQVTNFRIKPLNKVVYTDDYCATAGTYDGSCITNAVAAVGNNSKVILSPHAYNLAATLTFAGLQDVEIAGSGPGTVLKRDGQTFSCTSCIGVSLHDLAIQTATVPTVVTPEMLPTASGSTPILIDRWRTGKGYLPTINDQDIVPAGSGGACRSKCISATQLNQSWYGAIVFTNTGSAAPSRLHLYNLSGANYDIMLFDVSYSLIDHNTVLGGKDFGGIGCWRNGSGCRYDEFSNNEVLYNGFNGIIVGGGDHLTITNNVLKYNGESGVKTYQGSGHQNTFVTVIDNTSEYNWYDGFDLSSNIPHSAAYSAYSTASGNLSHGNHQTGFTSDGRYWIFTRNLATANGTDGMRLDLCYSTILGNNATGNNTSGTRSVHQLVASGNVACASNLVIGNSTDTQGHRGNGIYAGGTASVYFGNREANGTNVLAPGNLSILNEDGTGIRLGSERNAMK